MELQIRPYTADDIKAMVRIWNEVVEAGDAFPQVTPLTEQNADEFFSAQTATMVADVNGIIFGMYILHPNGIGRCAHIANASFAVASASRGLGLGRKLLHLFGLGRNGALLRHGVGDSLALGQFLELLLSADDLHSEFLHMQKRGQNLGIDPHANPFRSGAPRAAVPRRRARFASYTRTASG